ncbi:MAG: multidrug effflux MFS transporter [Rhodobiaceae bacterium]|nr:multidrug effflux MFS transporter [Rhodobiaceae bacterium]MCC0055338.1 multidrug effflux MFS transporter [Rhodobiaceae bacterium]
MTTLLAMMTALGPMASCLYLPSFPAMVAAFGGTPAEAQLTLSVFSFGMASGVLVYGPVADHYGRKPVLLVAMAIFVVASLACIFVPDLQTMAAMRFIQALGASGPLVLGRSIVRDLYEGARAGAELARLSSIMGLVPAMAPILGGVLQQYFGWPSTFIAIAGVGAFCLTGIALTMPETAPSRQSRRMTPGDLIRSYVFLSRHWVFWRYTILVALSYAGLFSLLSASPHILQDIAGLSPFAFGVSFNIVMFGYIGGTISGRMVVSRVGMERAIGIGTIVALVGAGAALATTEMLGVTAWTVLPPIALAYFGIGMYYPQGIAGALIPFPERAGAASSLMTSIIMLLAAIVGLVVGHSLGDTARPLTFALLITGVLSLVFSLLPTGHSEQN